MALIDGAAARIDDAALREAQQAKDAVRAYELVYAALGAGAPPWRARRPRRRYVVGQGAARLSDDGAVVARAEVGHPLSTPRPGWAEQDPEDWWAGRRRCSPSSAAPRDRGHRPDRPDARARRARREDCVLRPAILWNDGRTAAQCAEIERRVGLQALIAQTGNRALPGFTAPKLLWLAQNEPDVYARIDRVLLPKDFVRLRLCGEHATDVADASGTLLFDVARRRWSDAVVQALEIDPRWLPRALESPEMGGRTDGGVPVAAGAGDQAAGALGVRIDRPGPASVVLGTSGVVFAASATFAPDRDGARARVLPRRTGCLAQHGRHALGGGLAALAARRRRAGGRVRRAGGRGRGLGARRRGPDVPAVSGGGAHPARRSRGARRVHRAVAAPRPRRARARGARGRRVRPARWPRPCCRSVRPADARARLGRGARASCGCASSRRCSSCRCSARPSTRARRWARRAGRRRGGRFADVHEAVAACVRPGAIVEPVAEWIEPYREARERFVALYPALAPPT